ncbi:hypothetical protein [Nonlabens sp.]|uniref:hypothetical protein n=1 Tax=Nonlabens sp. TaxID=1888209 RepID=UPI003263408E
MKSVLLTLFFSLFALSYLQAQVAIGTSTPAPGTILHMEDSTGTSGVLFPKVDIQDLNTVAPLPTGSQDGTIVYNTNTSTGAGYYFLKDNRWQPIFGTIGGMAKFTNGISGNSSHNLNNGGVYVQIAGATYFNDNAVVYQVPTSTPGNSTVTIGETGRYKIIVNLSLEGISNNTNQRLLAIEGRLRVNGNNTGGIYRSQEMISPNNTTPDYSSISFTEIVDLSINDQVTVYVNRTQDNGNVYLRSDNTSSIFIERLN